VLLKFAIRPPLTASPLIAISFCLIAEKFILFSFHPVTTEFLKTSNQISEILTALNKIKIPDLV
jgi:hypothetical protein